MGLTLMRKCARAETQEIWQTLCWKAIGFSYAFEELYLDILRTPMVLDGFRHARAAARAFGSRGII